METVINKNNVNDEALFEESYQRLLPEFQALSTDECTQISLEIPSAVSTALGTIPEIRARRDDIVGELPRFDIVRFDKLEDYAMALSHANTQHLIATQPPDDLQAIHQEGISIRETLYADVATLIRRGLINAAAIKDLKGPNGYKNVATDLQILASLLKDNWSQIEGKCAVQMVELKHALKLAARILRVVGLREQGPAMIAATADMRLRAFTLFTRAYDDARRAVIFLRWHEGDANSIAPSLYAGRGNGRKKATADNGQNPAATSPAVTIASAVPAAGSMPANTAPSAVSADKPAAVGTPNHGPFVDY
jgi:hypothetical protein